MNSAPAELLHPLTYAALQLSWLRLCSAVAEPGGTRLRATTKKNASGLHASVRNTLPEKPSGFSKEKPPSPIGSG